MVQTLRIWKDGVTFVEQGNFQDALMNFMALEGRTDNSQQLITSGRNLFNIGQTYSALGRMDMAAKVRTSFVLKYVTGSLRELNHELAIFTLLSSGHCTCHEILTSAIYS